jgi:light-regulated signal transduction histidine kinase (bacteriophytochrome)
MEEPIQEKAPLETERQNAALQRTNREQRLEIEGLKAANFSLGGLLAELRHVQQHIEILNQDLSSRNAALEAVNQELEAFCYAVSHDLRNPLRSIHGFSEALWRSSREKLGPEETSWLQRICDAATRMDQLIEDLLKLSRVTRAELRRQRVDLTALARDVASQLTEMEPERKVRWDIDENLQAAGDPILIRVVLENLLGNAWKYTSRRSEAVISFRREECAGRKVFCVRDNGVGFDMAYARKLFTPFQRLHSIREFPGSGVGLACVARVLHRHGGTITAEAKVDVGAAFCFTLSDGAL